MSTRASIIWKLNGLLTDLIAILCNRIVIGIVNAWKQAIRNYESHAIFCVCSFLLLFCLCYSFHSHRISLVECALQIQSFFHSLNNPISFEFEPSPSLAETKMKILTVFSVSILCILLLIFSFSIFFSIVRPFNCIYVADICIPLILLVILGMVNFVHVIILSKCIWLLFIM